MTTLELVHASASPWSRGGRTLLLCPRRHCGGDAWCPEAREHLLLPVERKVAR